MAWHWKPAIVYSAVRNVSKRKMIFSAAERVVSNLNFFRFFYNRLGYDVHSTTKSTFTFPERARIIYYGKIQLVVYYQWLRSD